MAEQIKMMFILICMVFSFFSFTKAYAEEVSAEVKTAPDYAKEDSWLAKAINIDKPVDVFYVYPTIYNEKYPPNMDINDHHLQLMAKHLLTVQAGVFSGSANLFAPYYRQMSFALLNSEEDTFENKYFRIGAEDVARAFDHYIKEINTDRPFILAGHSQGSMVLIDLMRKAFNDQELQQRLVAAYLIGYSVTEEDLKNYPWFKPAQKADDTGVIISYNTQAPQATGSPVLLKGAICINPLNWKTTEEKADRSLNLGAVFFSDTTNEILREIPYYAGAHVDKKTGALVSVIPDKLDIGAFPEGVYHKYDYAFWYRNLEKNAAQRIDRYLLEHENDML